MVGQSDSLAGSCDGDTLYLGALLLQSGQLPLVQVGGVQVNFGQLSVGVHELLHRLLRNAGPDGGVDALHRFEHCGHAGETRQLVGSEGLWEEPGGGGCAVSE